MKPTTDFAIRSFIGGYDKNFTYFNLVKLEKYQKPEKNQRNIA